MHDIQAAIEVATFTQLDDIARTVWSGYGTLFDDDTAQSLGDAIEARRRALAPSTREMSHKPATTRHGPPRRPCRSPDRSRSIARRRQLAASGAVPGSIAVAFTQGELAVLTVIAREIQRSGICEWFMDRIAAVAGVSRTTTRNALRQAQALGLITVEERRRNRWRSDTNLVTVVSDEWKQWLRLGGGRKKPGATNNQPEIHGEKRASFPVRSRHQRTQVIDLLDDEPSRRPETHLNR